MAAMVRGLREHPNDSQFLSMTIGEIKQELSSTNLNVKTNAFLKLGYLSMVGVDLSMAQMPIIEVMSSSNFLLKRPAMLVASLAFKDNAELALLTTNIFLKELRSPKYIEVSTALTCLASMCTRDIADGVCESLCLLSTHSRPIIRKKVAIAMFVACEKSPSIFQSVVPKLKDLLTDADQTVQSGAVASFLEFSRRNSRLVVPLIPIFFHLLKEIKNNWIVIKLLRLMMLLCTAEPRLWIKLVTSNVMSELIDNTKAKSVQVEFCRFVLCVAASNASTNTEEEIKVVSRALSFLTEFLESTDMNIRSIALGVVCRVLQGLKTTEPSSAVASVFNRETVFIQIVKAADSTDPTIRGNALSALALIVDSPESAVNVIQQLLGLFTKLDAKRNLQLEVVGAILGIGPSLIQDTEWYLRILILLGSDACLDEPTGREIVTQIKRLVRTRSVDSAEACLGISVAALRKDQLPPSLVGACMWILGELCLDHWSDGLLSKKACEHLVSKQGNFQDENLETGVNVLWGLTRIATAFYLRNRDKDIFVHLEKRLDSIEGSLTLGQVCGIVRGLIHWITAEEPNDEEIRQLVFADWESGESEIKEPENLDEPMIELPSSLKADPRTISSVEIDEDIYTDTEESSEVEPKEKTTDMFSIASILRQ